MIDRKLDGGQKFSAHELSLHAIIEDRKKNYSMLKLCQRCAFECKKHGAKDLKFECFESKTIKEEK